MKTVFKTFADNIYNPAYYREILNRPKSYSWKYFFFFSVLLSVFMIVPSVYPLSKFFDSTFPVAVGQLKSAYPDDLKITLSSGVVEMNAESPQMIPMPSEWRSRKADIQNIAVIDTRQEPTLEMFREYNTALLVGKTSIAYMENNRDGSISIQSLSDVPDGSLDQSTFDFWSGEVVRYRNVIIFGLLLFAFLIAFLVNFLGHLVYLVFGALIVMLTLRVRGKNVSYMDAYRIGMHAITPASIYGLLTYIFLPLRITFVFSILLAITVYANFSQEQNETVSVEPLPDDKPPIA